MTLTPRLEALPTAQLTLWPQLASVPSRYVLYRGTAIALRLAHRQSVDFDFFAHDPLDHRELESLPFVATGQTIQHGPNERSVLVASDSATVKVSFFGDIKFGRVGEPQRTDDGVLRVASLLDLAGTKIKALIQRIEAKDYRDVIALLDGGLPLTQILGAASSLFGRTFNHVVAQKALCYFEGGDLVTLEDAARSRLVAAAGHDLAVEPLPLFSQRLD